MVDRPGRTWRGLSLCTGIGGLDIGAELALGHARTVCMVEREAFAVAHLAQAMEAGWMAPCPVWSDARTFNGKPWRGAVDYVTAGYPCQPFSQAGRRRGADDPRHLWPDIARIIGETEPELVMLENVTGHVRLGLDAVLSDLAAMGFDAEWGCLRASDVGAPHRRERLFVLAHPDRRRLSIIGERDRRNIDAPRGASWVAARRREHDGRCDAIFPPGPDDIDAWRQVLDEDETLEPALCCVAHGATAQSDRVQRLAALGNGVVPLQAAVAFRLLLDRAGVA